MSIHILSSVDAELLLKIGGVYVYSLRHGIEFCRGDMWIRSVWGIAREKKERILFAGKRRCHSNFQLDFYVKFWKTPFYSRAIFRLTKQRDEWLRKLSSEVLPIMDSGLGLRNLISVKTKISGSGIWWFFCWILYQATCIWWFFCLNFLESNCILIFPLANRMPNTRIQQFYGLVIG